MAADVELDRVTKLYGAFKAVDDVSFHIKQGSFVTLLGPSGAGTSTALRMIGGFELPDYGTIRIAGTDVTMLPPYRRDVNTVFQNYALFPHMDAAENIAYGLRQAGVAGSDRRKRVREALEMVQMLPLAHRRPSELSGGQQQRIALARALVKRPSVLLLDEPLGALDRKLRKQMQVELKMLQSQLGLTFVFVTHDQEEALAMSDSIVVMRNGRIEQIGTATRLYDAPETAFVADFIGAQNFIPGQRIDGTSRMRGDADGSFEAGRIAEKVLPSAKVLGAVRPENVALARGEPPPSQNRLAAVVAASVMLGDTVEFVLRTREGRELISRVPRHAAEMHPVGTELWAHWHPRSFCLFPHEDIDLKGSARVRAES
jgi:spermidine/putrescine transport system ATP-binding protein